MNTVESAKEGIDEILVLGTEEVVKRKRSFVESAFDLTYCIDFSKADYKNTEVQ